MCAFLALSVGCKSVETSKPNLVFILADDMGYGDVTSTNPGNKNSTPSLDKLSDEGLVFTDMHSTASWCTPSRYGLLTGAYPSRTDLGWTKHPVIVKDEMTLPKLLKNNGYNTAMIGKWHLGFETGMNFMADKYPGGPFDRGFGYFYGIPQSLDIQPYLYIQNDKPVKKPTVDVAAKGPSDPVKWTNIQGEFYRKGKMSPGFDHNKVLDVITDQSVSYIKEVSKDQPFFLYVPLTAPHTPWLPGKRFIEKTPKEIYFAFMAHVDDCVGRIDAALKENGVSDNTIFIVSSDNGPVWYDKDIKRTGHKSTGKMRGMKGDAWEGGHRVPFIVRWPNGIKPGKTAELASFTDMVATMADIVGDEKHGGKFRDGHSLKQVFKGGKTTRDELVMLATGKYVAVRKGDWKLIPFLGSGGFSKPKFIKPAKGEKVVGQLYNLKDDPSETKNLYAQNPEKVKELEALMAKYQADFKK
jgi:arylsulfatase A-like enzyme